MGKKILIILITILIFVLVGMGTIFYFLISDENNNKENKDNIKKEKSNDLTEIGILIPIDDFIVNLLSNNSTRYLKISLTLEFAKENEKISEEIEKKKPLIRDEIISILTSKSPEELYSEKTKEKIKEEIKSNLNKYFLKEERIKNIYFTDFVIQ